MSALATESGKWVSTATGLLVPAATAPRCDQPIGIDLFAGAGGFSLGFTQAGFHMAAAVEYDVHAALTYLVNQARPGVKIHFGTDELEQKFTTAIEKQWGLRPSGKKKGKPGLITGPSAGDGWISNQPPSVRGCEQFFIADVRNLTGKQILDSLGLARGDVTAVCGGPPCQGFSSAGARNVMDPRNSLVFEFARLVLEINPKCFVMENVPAMVSMLTPEGVPVIDALCRVMSDGGFGTYNALKASLHAQAGTGAAMRRDSGPVGSDEDTEEDHDADEQLDLFGGAA